jgi:hypothetical protein
VHAIEDVKELASKRAASDRGLADPGSKGMPSGSVLPIDSVKFRNTVPVMTSRADASGTVLEIMCMHACMTSWCTSGMSPRRGTLMFMML